MHNRLIGWINGRARETIGGYWGSLGVCLVRQSPGEKPIAVYVPIAKDAENSAWDESLIKLEAICGTKRSQMALSVALNADDMFVRTIIVPEGLDEHQLEQVAIVEAVANLPVPPEEVCLDLIRGNVDGHNEEVKIAFCRREKIDEILASAEEVGLPVHVVDRDVQAIHDVIAHRASQAKNSVGYPFGIVLTEVLPRIAICIEPTDFEIYPIRLQQNDDEDSGAGLFAQLRNCWTRCRMSRAINAAALERVYVVGSSLPQPLTVTSADLCKHIETLSIGQSVETVAPNGYAPDEVILIALGMTNRSLE